MFDFYQKYPVLSFDPSGDFAYNNSGYMMLAMVVERVSGVSFGQFVEQRLFLPNGMKRAVYCQDEVEGVDGATASYRYNAAKKRFKKSKSYPNILGATGAHCTLRDLAKWQFNFARCLGAGQGDPFFEKMSSSYELVDGRPTRYGMGVLCKQYNGRATIEHAGLEQLLDAVPVFPARNYRGAGSQQQ
jgi:Beta-lactamase class C and other penicillin binding proteins